MHRYQPQANKENNFMYFVQLHERAWGMDSYPKRPQLEAILNAEVVVFWQVEGQEDRYMVSLHESMNRVESYFARLLFRGQVANPRKRVVRIFCQQKRLIIKGVKLDFRQADDE